MEHARVWLSRGAVCVHAIVPGACRTYNVSRMERGVPQKPGRWSHQIPLSTCKHFRYRDGYNHER